MHALHSKSKEGFFPFCFTVVHDHTLADPSYNQLDSVSFCFDSLDQVSLPIDSLNTVSFSFDSLDSLLYFHFPLFLEECTDQGP